jgi:hypothetical protein
MLTSAMSRKLSYVCVVAALFSIAASIGIWFLYKSAEPAHAERFGIFVGLWAPTFLGLACWLSLRRVEAR